MNIFTEFKMPFNQLIILEDDIGNRYKARLVLSKHKHQFLDRGILIEGNGDDYYRNKIVSWYPIDRTNYIINIRHNIKRYLQKLGYNTSCDRITGYYHNYCKRKIVLRYKQYLQSFDTINKNKRTYPKKFNFI